MLASDDGDSGSGRVRTGVVSKKLDSDRCQVTLSDGVSNGETTIVVTHEEAARGVFANLRKDLPLSRQHVWPVSSTASVADTVRLRRQRREQQQQEATNETEPKSQSQAVKRGGRARSSHAVAIKEEPGDASDGIDRAWLKEHDCGDIDDDDLRLEPEGGPAVDPSVLSSRKVAKDFPPGLPNVLWCALNSAEPQTGANFLQNMLCVHDSIPPATMIEKLMNLMKYGPRAEGSSTVYFKDPHRTELAAQFVYDLVSASSRLVRRGESGALFGPSSWDDIEVLLSQSTSETENMISGRRLAQGLQLAARGARLLSLMLLTELQGHDLYSSTFSYAALDSACLKAMPTVRLISTYGVRSGLKAAVTHATKCLVRHSRWILDRGDRNKSTAADGCGMSISDECCALEAKACLDSLGSTICIISWLFCVEERVDMARNPTACAFVIKDEFLAEMERSLDDELPEMSKLKRRKFVDKLKMAFLLSLSEEFAGSLVSSLGKMIGVENALVGLE